MNGARCTAICISPKQRAVNNLATLNRKCLRMQHALCDSSCTHFVTTMVTMPTGEVLCLLLVAGACHVPSHLAKDKRHLRMTIEKESAHVLQRSPLTTHVRASTTCRAGPRSYLQDDLASLIDQGLLRL